MSWSHHPAWFAGGIIFTNAMLHFISGVSGSTLQTVFAIPPDRRLSVSATNLPRSMVNLLAGWLLPKRVGDFDSRSAVRAGVFGLGVLRAAIEWAWRFGCFHDGNAPTELSGTQ